jgi:predicted DNA-binding WGR domain protein
MSRYFEFQDKSSSKFWEITVTGKTVTVHYGKIGTAGQNTIKELPTPEEANTHAEKVIGEKTKKGYKEKKK